MDITSQETISSGTIPTIQKKAESLSCIAVVFFMLLGVGAKFYLVVVGQLYISEIVLVAMSPILILTRTDLLKNKWVKMVYLLGGVWFFSQVVTDLIRDTPFSDFIRGWANILVFLLSFLALFILLGRNLSKIKFYLFGYVAGGLLQPILQPNIYFASEPWKFGFGSPIIMGILLLIVHLDGNQMARLRKWTIPLVLLAGLTFYLNARSLGAIVLMTAVLTWLGGRKSFFDYLRRPVQPFRLIFLTLILAVVGFGVIRIYQVAVEQGLLGNTAKAKYETQMGAGTSVIGFILGGRTEVISSYYAILDSPIIGHGSWPRDSIYVLRAYRTLQDMGYNVSVGQLLVRDYTEAQQGLIPTHSNFFQAWVWSGILGALFWVAIGVLVIKAFLNNFRNPNPLFIITLYFCLESGWDILFSPFNDFMRLEFAIRLVFFIIAMEFQKKSAPQLIEIRR